MRPRADEIELTAFGPGYGECLVVHLGGGDWAIVDSCISTDRKHPALEYLASIGVDVSTAVKLVVATHWHDDHVRGLAKVVAACVGARIFCSIALNDDELLVGIGAFGARQPDDFRSRKTTSGVDEMKQVVTLLSSQTARFAIEDRLLARGGATPGYRVWALSPCDAVVSSALGEIRERVITDRQGGRVRRPDRNLGSVVLWIEVADVAMLLGADLQEHGSSHRGWTAVVGSTTRPAGVAEVLKAPHHGSVNGHHQPVWDDMLVQQPEVIVCPCSNGNNDLPGTADISRLCSLGGRVHLTAPTRAMLVRRNARPRRRKINDFRVTLRRRIGVSGAWVPYDLPPAHDPCRPPAPSALADGT